jgi:isopenicillin N synthase-like dioxygenase
MAANQCKVYSPTDHSNAKWLPEATTPGLRPAIEAYLEETQALANEFILLIAEALDLDAAAFTKLLQGEPPMSSLRIGAYRPPDSSQPPETEIQGVGAHKDASFLTYLLQGTGHSCLEVQNKCGTWIPAPPIPNTLVVNIGRSLETLTQGVCVATTHRVNLKSSQYQGTGNAPLGTRLSFAFFQMLALEVTREDMLLELPSRLVGLREKDVNSEAETFFVEVFKGSAGQALLTNIITSYPELGKRWYPDLLANLLKDQHEMKLLDDARLCREA